MNKEAVKAFEDHKVKVVTLSDADYNAWLDVAKKSSYAKFAKDVPERPKADRRGARGQIAYGAVAAGGASSPAVVRD